MGLTPRWRLAAATAGAGALGYLLIPMLYRQFPAVTLWTGLWLLAVAGMEAGWAITVRGRIRNGQIGVGAGRLHPLAVARSVAVAKASAWAGALILGWWLAVLAYLLPRRTELRVAAADTPGVAVAALSAFVLVIAALWLENCCRSPEVPTDDPDPAGA